MDTLWTRPTDTQVQVDNKLYGFRSRDHADRFVQCLREKNASQCVAECVPDSTTDAYPQGTPNESGAGITIGPPPGALDSEE
ncbi:hypothetical protein ACFQ3P_00530 [Paraburkholderia sabiae]|uniref:Uncharacterized protein n=1 Tax=Paraburkholderia sabiae TaxID=273251 RepID=A0ABU9Q8R3_9BURK|nr:hypothetical protein [Paraburkholderia sabiae]WJZ78373.1 hypothetical protein QEN71_30740 [Paraburkholderia sabiae]CAD6507817.1 hypothetical protein LMG24235_00105 [Paraburkholderia sabiae]